MSAKFNLGLILVLSIFATAAIGIYITHQHSSVLTSKAANERQEELSIAQPSSELVTYPERHHYKTIPLAKITSILQGSDPANLALNALDGIAAEIRNRKIEIAYLENNQALVTITQHQRTKSTSASTVKYRVEMTSFGRSILVSSPPIWEIVWIGVGNGE
jgi:hypothetical protein